MGGAGHVTDMARSQNIAKLLSHIAACHTATLPGARLPFFIGVRQVGFVTAAFAGRLAACAPDITAGDDGIVLAADAAWRLNDIATAAGIPPRGGERAAGGDRVAHQPRADHLTGDDRPVAGGRGDEAGGGEGQARGGADGAGEAGEEAVGQSTGPVMAGLI